MCHESVSVGVANQGLGPIKAINGTMGGRWEQLEEDGGRQWKMEHPKLSNRLLGGKPWVPKNSYTIYIYGGYIDAWPII